MALIMSNQQERVQLPAQLKAKLDEIAKVCLEIEEVDGEAEISLVFVDDAEIQKLNHSYRNLDEPTDVLSFPLWDEDEEILGELLLGDIIISLETAQRQGEEYGHSLEREIAYLMVHGLLHLLGYDHLDKEEKEIMRCREEEILEKINLGRDL